MLLDTRSSIFFLTLEQAVVKGGRVLIEYFPSTMDPALQPLLEIGNCTRSGVLETLSICPWLYITIFVFDITITAHTYIC